MSVSFFYRDKEYFAIVRHRFIKDQGYYSIRVMNNRIDSMLNKHKLDMLKEKDGKVVFEMQQPDTEQGSVYNAIAQEIIAKLDQSTVKHGFEMVRDFRLITPN